VKDLSIEIRLRNNRLLARRRELGLSQLHFAAIVGVDVNLYAGLETMRIHPIQTHSARGPLKTPRWRPTALKLAEYYGCDPSELFPSFALSGKPAVLVVERDEDELGLLVGQASHAMLESPEDALARRELRAAIDDALSTLTDRERSVLTRRYGLDGAEPMTLQEIANITHAVDPSGRETERVVQHERIRQIEAKALRKLRHPARSSHLLPWKDDGDETL
jgi:RNA polymerase sigma factor (sigma-70 family)